MVGYAQNSVENIEIDVSHFSSIYALLLASLPFCDFSTVSFTSQYLLLQFQFSSFYSVPITTGHKIVLIFEFLSSY